MKTSLFATLTFIAAVSGAGGALAQMPPGEMHDHTGMAAGGMRMPMDQGRHDRHMKALHEALNIRPDQEQAFGAFAGSMRPQGKDGPDGPGGMRGGDMHDHDAMAGMTTPQRLDRMSQMMDAHISRMREMFQRHAAAVKSLYAVLSPEQRRTLDALPDLMGHGMMGHGMGHEGGEGHEGHGGRPE